VLVVVARDDFEAAVLRLLPILSFSGPRELSALLLEFFYNGVMMLPPCAAALHLIVPMMAWMQHWDDGVRRLASLLFAACIQQYHERVLMDLQENSQKWQIKESRNLNETENSREPFEVSQKQLNYEETLARIQGLFDPSTIPDYILSFRHTFTLRPYQQAGLNWLSFLRTYGLSGILADDMGLGKTLQTLCILAATHHELEGNYAKQVVSHMENTVDNSTKDQKCSYDFGQASDRSCFPPPSLIVAPASVLGHWQDEVQQYVGEVLRPYLYVGPRGERQARLRAAAAASKEKIPLNVILTSYDVVRNDIHLLTSLFPLFTYVVLDEGHAIRNPRSRVAVALKEPMLRSTHRLILSGTPIQNDILDCWALFDWLLPGYLGTLPHFMRRFGRPILAYKQVVGGARVSNSSAAAAARRRKAACLGALDALHKLTLPFMLRRLKEDVLQDLPPKTIIRFPCLLAPDSLQGKLYSAYLSYCRGDIPSEALEASDSSVDQGTFDQDSDSEAAVEENRPLQPGIRARPHVFQMLHNLKKICNHPALLLHPQYMNSKNGRHPGETAFWQRFPVPSEDLVKDLHVSAKFVALFGILRECGILKMTQDPFMETIENDRVHQKIHHNDQKDLKVDQKDLKIEQLDHLEEFDEGEGDRVEDVSVSPSVVEESRMLIFCHSKAALDLLEEHFFKRHCPQVTYLRLDASVAPQARAGIVRRFQGDRAIQVLLLTTAAGGQGLNLTGANVVVFFENHDNPAVDLQAMDRVHRIGQRRHVCIYKLYMADSIEEKLLRLQEFKMTLVRHVITTQNIHLTSMSTKDVLAMLTES
jgi:TATA-binding protein-associated factor